MISHGGLCVFCLAQMLASSPRESDWIHGELITVVCKVQNRNGCQSKWMARISESSGENGFLDAEVRESAFICYSQD